MIWVLLSILGLFLGFVIYAKKFNNPYKLIFIFGKKGSGKSCLLVHELLKYQKKGYTVYTDMPVNIPNVRLIDAEDLKKFKPVENSALFLDEVGLTWSNRDFKNFDKGLTEFFKLQRHYRCIVMMNSQSFDVDKKIRDVTDSMILQSNIMNVISVSRPILRRVTLVEATAEGESRIADNLVFDKLWHWRFYWMPKYFKYFDSHSVIERPEIKYRDSISEFNQVPKYVDSSNKKD